MLLKNIKIYVRATIGILVALLVGLPLFLTYLSLTFIGIAISTAGVSILGISGVLGSWKKYLHDLIQNFIDGDDC
jgi:hypothetical protein